MDPSITAALIGVIGTIVVTILSVFGDRLFLPTETMATPSATLSATPTSPSIQFTPSPTQVPFEMLSLDEQVVSLRQSISNLEHLLSDYEGVRQRLDDMTNRLDRVYRTIQDNPNRAVETVILRNDIENLKDEVMLLRDEIDSSKNQNFLNIALIVPLGITLISLAVPLVSRFRSKMNDKNDEVQQ